ncbi:MAG: O-phosphoserine--tRNA ligase [Candidatus Hadarchaeota archaeon]|nr:O-phosphoserine--tRNA ligase [Candidatus Hadarchaeota archaeon]
MAKLDVKEIRKRAKEDYEKAWLESGKLLKKRGKLLDLTSKRKEHPLSNLIFKTRKILLDLGFTEVVVPTLIDKSEVFKQYGSEAPVILDRVFFLAGLERPDIGISQKKLGEIGNIVPGFKAVKKLQSIFRRYKEGKIGPDDLTEVLVEELGLKEEQATALLSLFEEFRRLRPVPMDLTLRSHTSAGWFGVLEQMQRREPLPLQLFSVGPKFRREQRLDSIHLYESLTASVVMMAEEISLEDGKRLTGKIMGKLGFRDVKCRIKRATSKYYAPRTEFEVFVRHPRTRRLVEVGDAGFYSPVALAQYDISYPVFNLGIGLERVLMVRTGEGDIRALVYPYLYREVEFSDGEIARMLKLKLEHGTEVGKKIAGAIVRAAKRHKDKPSPCEFKAFEGRLSGKKVVVKLVEPESGTKLIGPAGFNQIFVHNGNVVGVPPEGWEQDKFLKAARRGGVSTGVSYMRAFASLAAHEIERAVREEKRRVRVRVPIVKLLSDINLELEEPAQRYITDNEKRIDVRGPVFTTIIAEIS